MVTKTGKVEVKLERIHIDRAIHSKLRLSEIESPAWVGLDVGLGVTVPEELISVYLKRLFILRSSVRNRFSSGNYLTISVKFVVPHGLHFKANIIVSYYWV